jgi:hypothetical protein
VRGSSTPLLEQRLLSFGGESAGRLTRYQDLTAPRSGVETRFAMRCSHYLICRTGHLSMICVLKPVALGLSGCHWLRPGGNDARRIFSSILPPGACHILESSAWRRVSSSCTNKTCVLYLIVSQNQRSFTYFWPTLVFSPLFFSPLKNLQIFRICWSGTF